MLPSQDQEQEVTTGDNSSVSQDATQASGAAVKADTVETVTTENITGISPLWFILGAGVFGMLIPQPRFIRWLF